MRLHPVKSKTTLRLGDADARPPAGAPRGAALDQAIDKETERLDKLQRVLYADARYALLVVLQGRDASGKDGTVRHVFRAVNPQGCAVTSFGVPTEAEAHHDFLWRVHQHVPARRMIGVFNRSHYEDVLVPRVRQLVPPKVWGRRYKHINHFEHMLADCGVVILKFFLHVSRAEQKRRLAERLTDPTKNWKFREGDLEDRAHWRAYTGAYRDMLRECSTRWARWYVVPSDDKRVRNWLVARTIADTLDGLALKYPRAPRSVLGLEIK
jgi:PPK2 family polyphosphate:nucleotide phosphotransferase